MIGWRRPLPSCMERIGAIGERARVAVADLSEPHTETASGIVTLSAGVAKVIPSLGDTPSELVKAADEALYQAKHHGRNRVWQRNSRMA